MTLAHTKETHKKPAYCFVPQILSSIQKTTQKTASTEACTHTFIHKATTKQTEMFYIGTFQKNNVTG